MTLFQFVFGQVIKSENMFHIGNTLQIRGLPLFHKLGHPLRLYRLLQRMILISAFKHHFVKDL